jgi:small subunit ribosomal protein S20
VANIKSAMKRARQSEARRVRNRAVRSRVRSVIKEARAAQGAERDALVREAARMLDKAVTKGVIHRNTAARKKSAMSRRRVPASV